MTKRTARIVIHVSPEERDRFDQAAEELGINRASFASEKCNAIGVERPFGK